MAEEIELTPEMQEELDQMGPDPEQKKEGE